MIYTNFREIDKAGRIVISKDIRRHLNIQAGCVFCNNPEDLTAFKDKYICESCLESLKAD